MSNFEQWIEEHELLVDKVAKGTYKIDGNLCYLLPKKDILFDGTGNLVVSDEELMAFDENECTHFIVYFGERYYLVDFESDELQLDELVYKGSVNSELKGDYAYLGIRGKFELCNGSRNYDDWCRKALFLGHKAIGICEKNTLAGTLPFQNECKANNLKSIIGETIDVVYSGQVFEVKLYVKDNIGWSSLLRINAQVNVFSDNKRVPFKYLKQYSEGLVCVIGSATSLTVDLITDFKSLFDDLYYQVDTVRWASNETDKKYLLNFKEYIDKYSSLIPPVFIADSFYLEQRDSDVKNLLNKIGKVGWQHQSEYQHFKSPESVFKDITGLFSDYDTGAAFWDKCLNSVDEINSLCNFEIHTGDFLLPVYTMTEEESKLYQSNEDMMLSICADFLEEKGLVSEKYIERLEEEFSVIKLGGFVDYFLILYDIVRFCDREGILVGVGRGSAGGSLVAYALKIIKIDPIEYDLLFERFLNKARIGIEEREVTEFEQSEAQYGLKLSLDDGKEIFLDLDSELKVLREGEEMVLSAKYLKENDEVLV